MDGEPHFPKQNPYGKQKMKILKSAGVAILAILVSLGIGEAICRLFVPYNDTYPIDIIPDKKLPYLMRPNSIAKSIYGIEIKTNSMGFRSAEVNTKKYDGEIRVLGLGDSTTFGYGVQSQESYLARIEALASSCPTGIYSGRLQTINTGHSAFNLTNYFDILDAYGDQLNPDIITVGIMGNDYATDSIKYVIKDGVGITPGSFWDRYNVPTFVIRLLRKSAFYITTGNTIKQASQKWLLSSATTDQAETQKQGESTVAALEKFAEYSREHDIPIVMIYLPTRDEVTSRTPSSMQFIQILKDYEKRPMIRFINLLDHFDKYSENSSLLFTRQDSVHPSSSGHKIISEIIFSYLRSNYKICP